MPKRRSNAKTQSKTAVITNVLKKPNEIINDKQVSNTIRGSAKYKFIREQFEDEGDNVFNTKKIYTFTNFNFLMFLWSRHVPLADVQTNNTILYSFTGSYDISDKKKSLLAISSMFIRKYNKQFNALSRFEMSELNDLYVKEFKQINKVDEFFMFTPNDIVRTFRLNVKNNEIKPNKSIKWQFVYTNEEGEKRYKIDEKYYDETLETILQQYKNQGDYFSIRNGRIKYYNETKEPKYNKYIKDPDNSIIYNKLNRSTFNNLEKNLKNHQKDPKLFSSSNALTYIPYFQNYNEMENVKKLIYYYKSKQNELNITVMEGKCAEELYNNFYFELLKKINTAQLKKLFPNEDEIEKKIKEETKEGKGSLSKKELGMVFTEIWKRQFAKSREVLKEVDEKYRYIANVFSKQFFTDLYHKYSKRAILPLNTTVAYFKTTYGDRQV